MMWALRLERMGLRWHWAVEEKVPGDGYTIVAGGYGITSGSALRAARRAAARHAWAVNGS
ncbi:MAG TPA: hypothetical protein VLA82_02380 [Actinomycetota bacterium]|nr:hypothetical protein [Actinomycetota bacterium]